MQIGKLSQGILNMKIDTFDSRTTPSEGKIPGLAVDAGNPLGLGSGGKSKNSKKKVRKTDFLYFIHNSLIFVFQTFMMIIFNLFQNKNKGADKGTSAVNSFSTISDKNNPSSSNKKSNGDTNYGSASYTSDAAAIDPAKKLRNLKKKLRDIEALEKKLKDGVISKPEPEQLEKVARKIQVETEIEELEKQLAN